MTVCVGIKVRDCIVFAADSAVSLMSPGNLVSNVWNHGMKVFNLYHGLPIVAMSAGLAHFGPASVSNLAKDLRQDLAGDKSRDGLRADRYGLRDVAERANDFFWRSFLDQPPVDDHQFEFWIGGYGAKDARGEVWRLGIVNGERQPLTQVVTAEQDDYVFWGGQSTAISRLIMGMDPTVDAELRRMGMTDETVNQLTGQVLTPLVHSAMPVQDAIDLADFLVDLTKRYVAFLPGADVVGGETEIATVTRHEGFKWIKRKHYYPEHLNRRDTDHVGRN